MNLKRTIAYGMKTLLPALAVMLVAPAVWAATTSTGPYMGTCSTQYVGLTNRIAGCIRDTVDASAATFFTEIYPMLQLSIGAVMTLAVIVYGIMLSYGLVERVGRDTMILLIKIAAVIAFCSNSPLLYRMTTQGMDGIAQAAVTFVPPSGMADGSSDFAQSVCLQNMVIEQAKADPTKPVSGPWLGIDCLLDTVIGIKVTGRAGETTLNTSTVWFNKQFDATTADTKNPGMSRSLLYLFFSGVQSSVFGLILAVTGFIFILGLLLVIVRALFTYLAGYIGVALLIIISPLIIPLVLFNSVTKVYFDKWLKLVISFALQPVIMLVFITFSLAAMDFAAFSGKYSIVYRIAGDASRVQGFSLNDYLAAPRTAAGVKDTSAAPPATSKGIIDKKNKTLAQVKADMDINKPVPKANTDVGGFISGQVYSKCTDAEKKKDAAVKKWCDETSYPILIKLNSIDWDRMAGAREGEGHVPVVLSDGSTTKGQQIAREVMSSVLFCAIVVFIMNGLLKVVPLVAHDLLGDANQSPDIASSITGKLGAGTVAGGLMSKLGGAARGGT